MLESVPAFDLLLVSSPIGMLIGSSVYWLNSQEVIGVFGRL